jgi:hypothetical protein
VGTTDEDVCVCVCINMEKLHMWSLNFISDNNLVLDFFSLQFCPFGPFAYVFSSFKSKIHMQT